jgi:hypothetical protein
MTSTSSSILKQGDQAITNASLSKFTSSGTNTGIEIHYNPYRECAEWKSGCRLTTKSSGVVVTKRYLHK